MGDAEALEFLEGWIAQLKESNKLVIVEGKKDVACLKSLGITNAMGLEKRPIFEVCETAAQKSGKIVILTDLDSEGKKLFSKLNSGLQHLGVETDNYFRESLFRNAKVRQVEGLCSHIWKIKEKLQGSRML